MNKIKHIVLAVLATAVSLPSLALDLDLDSGISAEVLNGKKVKDENYELVKGDNQFVFEFSGKLKDGHKREYYSSRPYIVTLDLENADVLKVELVSNRLSSIEKKVNKREPIFKFTIDGKAVNDSQEMLPPAEGAFPYSNVPALVDTYNKERGLVFDSGKVVELKAELAKLEQSEPIASGERKTTTIAGVTESENTLQLKLWYLRASDEERKNFKRWMIEQD
ncbi:MULTISPECIES: DUF2057 family protein [Vibrio]|nr:MULTISPECIES: DUF2057 family protein [Vibrio]MCM5506762.1 DUF2057 family protein [Vibrio sp. SCSIO 43169]EEX31573.1 hypothetical protein VIC_004521 [Vibrio coralliilyticus ATCC BAA-450]MDE3898761.1 DUF2057 family protein [Vibrio sp. CC007]QFT36906.1 hypothetical protein FIU99_10700 [Vibrio sp. THAF64]QGM34807.1 hypothetical protein GGC04_10715 [Vibrio sp. THAF191d]